MVPRGASRSNRRAHPSRLSWARGFLPSWPCEFDSRHPLHSRSPNQQGFRRPSRLWSVGRSLRPGHSRATSPPPRGRSGGQGQRRSRGRAHWSRAGRSAPHACCRGPFGASPQATADSGMRTSARAWRAAGQGPAQARPAARVLPTVRAAPLTQSRRSFGQAPVEVDETSVRWPEAAGVQVERRMLRTSTAVTERGP